MREEKMKTKIMNPELQEAEKSVKDRYHRADDLKTKNSRKRSRANSPIDNKPTRLSKLPLRYKEPNSWYSDLAKCIT